MSFALQVLEIQTRAVTGRGYYSNSAGRRSSDKISCLRGLELSAENTFR
jgi:hypothetical protein